INGLGVLGWGVGGIEAEAVMLGQPIYMLLPEVVGVRLEGALPEGTTATDLVLTITESLRAHGVVGKFVEFFGPGLPLLSLPDRATIGNMAPEYGATMGFFPVDQETLRYLELSGRAPEQVELVEAYTKAAGMFHTTDSPEPEFSDVVSVDMSLIKPSIAGPKRPQDRIELTDLKSQWPSLLSAPIGSGGFAVEQDQMDAVVQVEHEGDTFELTHGKLVLAAITSCTNTSNPSVMVAAGLLAKAAVERGLRTKPWVKTSMAPGSKVVTSYLEAAGLDHYLEELNFHTVGYGCTTCIGNSGPLPDYTIKAIADGDLTVSSVLSGNRNFEGRINPDVKANFLASPPLVVAFALAGTVDIDLSCDPIGTGSDGSSVLLEDIWPSQQEIRDTIAGALTPEMFRTQYGNVFSGNQAWNDIPSAESDIYHWDPTSTYVHEPPFFMGLSPNPEPMEAIHNANVLAIMPDSTTTDHISPAGSIATVSPAADYLRGLGLERREWNTYGTRRGNHEVMMRGTFANVRIKNQMLDGREGGYTIHVPTKEEVTIYDAAMRYRDDNTPLVILAGKEYGTGSSRDWAAKGTHLLGVKAVIAESYERIHRSNLVGMGVLPLQFKDGTSADSLGLTGLETVSIDGIDDNMEPGQTLVARARSANGTVTEFSVDSRIDTPVELEYYRHGGILNTVLRSMLKNGVAT
ncbi:MAG: aconitate hydratase AcnA, partial [Caldilineaceae bacterium SB0666_bin_21]|nr:aconitate hydratase AcnA [Caldilineaceae bacterium SB0666_bin_21]